MQPRESKGQDQLENEFWALKKLKKSTRIKKGRKIFIEAKIGKILIWIHSALF